MRPRAAQRGRTLASEIRRRAWSAHCWPRRPRFDAAFEVAPGDVRHVTHDESSVYWAMADGELWSMPLGGGAPKSLGIVEEVGAPLTAHGGSLYFRQDGTNALGRIPIGGGAP